jgi:3-methyladenine DNA glycosylase AlkD
MTAIRQALGALADPAYRAFQSGLLPTVAKERILGVRTPVLRRYAKTLWREQPEEAKAFLRQLPHVYYEENNLHMELLCLQKLEIRALLEQVEAFLPCVDNWATCDGRAGTLFAKYPAEAQAAAVRWLQSDRVYTVRFGMVTLLSFVRTAFDVDHLHQVALPVLTGPCREEYYVRMAAAWYFSMALVHQWDTALPWITENRLPAWVHNKAIQKACESYQLTKEKKAFLRQYRHSTAENE